MNCELCLLAISAVALLLVWLIQLRSKDFSAIDIAWTVMVGANSLALLQMGEGDVMRRVLAGGLIAIWSLRLCWHLVARLRRHPVEDGRYADLRAEKGTSWNAWALLFTGAQLCFVVVFCLIAWAVARDPRPLGQIGDWLGIALWLGGWLIESLADHQLAAWRAAGDNHGRTCRAGLWRYSRHPNYFGELLQWAGLACLASAGPYCWLAWLQVLLVYLLIRFMTGVPYAELRALKSRGDDYRSYQRETPPLIPWFPKVSR